MNRTTTTLAALALAAGGAQAQQRVLIDFGDDFGGGTNVLTVSPDANGNHWHNMDGPFYASLTNTVGDPTDFGIGFVSNYGVNGGAAGGGLFFPQAALLGDFAVESATQDYMYSTPLDPNLPSLNFDVFLLNPDATYTFRFFGSRDEFVDYITEYTVVGGNGTFTAQLQTSGFAISSDGFFDGNDDTIVEISGVTPGGDDNNLINIDVATANETFAYINILEIIEEVQAPCAADVNADGVLDNGDIGAFVTLFLAGDLAADFTGDGILDNGDIGAFVSAFLAGCD
ncbi:MAG: GC-type dockerin domain-anchored protein [Phycisphaerales bacterium JB040]